MPIANVQLPAEVYLEHKGVKVYHVYEDSEMSNEPWYNIFSLSRWYEDDEYIIHIDFIPKSYTGCAPDNDLHVIVPNLDLSLEKRQAIVRQKVIELIDQGLCKNPEDETATPEKERYFGVLDSGELVDLGELTSFCEADEKSPGNTNWIYTADGLAEFVGRAIKALESNHAES